MRLVRGSNNSLIHEALFQGIMGPREGREGDNDDILTLPQLEILADMIGLSLDDSSMYCLAWSWSCQTPLSITKAEFMKGMMLLDISIKKVKLGHPNQQSWITAVKPEFKPYLSALRNHIDEVDKVLHNDPKEFRRFYRFIFKWVRSPETMTRSLGEVGMNIETAVELWRMLFPEYKPFLYLDDWIQFCTSKDWFTRDAISRDLWEQLLEFTSLTSYDTYDVNDAWPSAIDDFVGYFKSTRKKIIVEN